MEETQEIKPSEPDVGSERKARIENATLTLENALPAVVGKLADEAAKGSVSHMKLLLQLLGLEDGALSRKDEGPRERTLEEILMEQWRNEP